MNTHTPIPWRVENDTAIRGTWEDGTPVQIAAMFTTTWPFSGDPRGLKTHRMRLETGANAAFLVHACNNYDALLGALYKLTDAITARGCQGLSTEIVAAYALARDAVAEAEKQ